MSAAKSTAKKDTKASVAAADRPIVLSKFKKQKRASAAKKSRTAQTQHLKKSASKTSSRTVAQSSKAEAQKSAAKEVAVETARPELPPEVANARAQALADDQARNIAALDTTKVSTVNGVLIAAADPPNNTEAAPDNAVAAQDPAPAEAPAVAPPPPLPSGKILRPVSSGEKQVLKSDDSDPWSKTSLIGKIFIAFGSLLTLASAARLIIA